MPGGSSPTTPRSKTVVGGLSNPCGVAVQPETGHVFVADSAAGRVIRVVDGKAEDVITGFAEGRLRQGPVLRHRPAGPGVPRQEHARRRRRRLQGRRGVSPRLHGARAGKPALNFDKDAKSKIGPIAPADGIVGEGNLYGLAATKTAIYVTCNGDDTKGWIAKADITGTKLGKLERFIADEGSGRGRCPGRHHDQRARRDRRRPDGRDQQAERQPAHASTAPRPARSS